jgi:hypothetical protein
MISFFGPYLNNRQQERADQQSVGTGKKEHESTVNINSVCTLQDFPHRDWTNWNWNQIVSAHAKRAYARVWWAALKEKKLSGMVPDSFVLYPLESKDIPP